MNLKEQTSRIKTMMGLLNEDFRDRMIDFIKKHGIFSAAKHVGNYDKLKRIVGKNMFTNEEKIKIMKDVVFDAGGFSLSEIRLEPIYYRTTENEQEYIEYFGGNKIIIQCWGGYEYQDDKGEYSISYESLSDDKLDKIFEIFVNDIDEIKGL